MIKILIIDDERSLCDYLNEFFTSRGHKAFIALNAKDALSLVEQESPELVLLDVNMPDMNGLDTLRLIKKKRPRTKVIMVTVTDNEDTKLKARVLGADEFITKPFTTEYLQDVVILKVNEITKNEEPCKILIIDNEEETRTTLKEFLKKRFECEISEAQNGEKALDCLRKGVFDLVFLDIKIPGSIGMDVINEKKNLEYVPAIWVITRFESKEAANEIIKQGADECFAKPVSLRALDGKIRNFLASIGKYNLKRIRVSAEK